MKKFRHNSYTNPNFFDILFDPVLFRAFEDNINVTDYLHIRDKNAQTAIINLLHLYKTYELSEEEVENMLRLLITAGKRIYIYTPYLFLHVSNTCKKRQRCKKKRENARSISKFMKKGKNAKKKVGLL